MRPSLKVTSPAVLLLALALAGCGSSSNVTEAHVPKVTFASPAIVKQTIPATYTCDGKNITPPLEWGAVPATTGELVLFILGIEPQGPERVAVRAEWALAGIKPELHRIAAGKVPAGAFAGLSEKGSKRYSLCPKKGETEEYQFELYGIPGRDAVSRRFVDSQVLGSLNTGNRTTPANVHGVFDAIYKAK